MPHATYRADLSVPRVFKPRQPISRSIMAMPCHVLTGRSEMQNLKAEEPCKHDDRPRSMSLSLMSGRRRDALVPYVSIIHIYMAYVAALVRPYSKITPDWHPSSQLNTRHPETAFNLPLIHLTELAATGVGLNT